MRDPILSDADFAAVRPQARGEQLLLHVRCHPEACSRLAIATGANTGRHLAVLVESRVRSLASIAGPVGSAGTLTIAVDASGPEAERIAAEVRSRWPNAVRVRT